MTSFIYEWKNKLDGKKYIGSHKGEQDDGYTGSGIQFIRAIEKDGIENFERTIVEVVADEDRFEIEQQYIDNLGAVESDEYYNLTRNCGGGWDYVNADPILRAASTYRWRNMHKIYGHPRGMLGKTHPNMAPCHAAAKKWLKENKQRSIEKWDLYGNYIETFESIMDAARNVGGGPSNIKYTADGKFKKAYNYVWKWSSE